MSSAVTATVRSRLATGNDAGITIAAVRLCDWSRWASWDVGMAYAIG